MYNIIHYFFIMDGAEKGITYLSLEGKKIDILGDGEVVSNVESIIGNNTLSYKIPSFIEVGDNAIYINTNLIPSEKELRYFFDGIFKEHYIENLDYDIFSKLIFDFYTFKNENSDKKIKLSSGMIRKFDIEKRRKYQKPTIHKNTTAEYTFGKLYDNVEINGKLVEVETSLNIDEFVSAMWEYGLKYGLKIDDIKMVLEKGETQRIIIAESTDAIKGLDARLLTLVNLGTDYELKTKNGGLVDLQEYKRVFPQIKSGTRIYQKIDSTPGTHGMNILGEIITPPVANDILLEELIEQGDSGIKIVEDNGIQFIVSEIDGYVTPIQGKYDSQKLGEDENNLMEVRIKDIRFKLKITEEIELDIVGPEVGNISTFGNVKTRGVSSGYCIEANNIEVNGDINGNTLGKNNVNVKGNITGGKHHKSHRNGVVTVYDGNVISEKGNITVDGNAFLESYIEAKKGNVEVTNVESATIVGKNVKIKNARNSIIVGDNIIIEGTCVDCLFIITNSINAKMFALKENMENVIFVCKPIDYEDEYKKTFNQMNDLNGKIEQLKKLIDQITIENDSILKDKKFTGYQNYQEKLQKDKDSINDNIKRLLIENRKWYIEQIEKLKINNEKIKRLNIKLTEIQGELEKISQTFQKLLELRSEETNPEISIKINRGSLKIFSISLPEGKSLLDLEEDEFKKLIDIKKFFMKSNYEYKLLENISSANIGWKYKK